MLVHFLFQKTWQMFYKSLCRTTYLQLTWYFFSLMHTMNRYPEEKKIEKNLWLVGSPQKILKLGYHLQSLWWYLRANSWNVIDFTSDIWQHEKSQTKKVYLFVIFPDFSLTFKKCQNSLTSKQHSLTFPWLLASLEFHWLFPDFQMIFEVKSAHYFRI